MKTNILHLILGFIVAGFLLACEENSDIETPDYNPKLVIHSFISPSDTMLWVHVGTNKNLYGKRIDYPQTLPVQVILMDGDVNIEFSPRNNDGFCTAKHIIQPGHKYTLKASCDGYPEISATCKVPDLKDYLLKMDTVSRYLSFNDGSYVWGYYFNKLIVKFDDTAGEKNYYSITSSQTITSLYNHYTINLSPSESEYEYNYQRNDVLSDNLVDGQSIGKSFKFDFTPNDTSLYNSELKTYLLETDADYYKYHRSLITYSGTDEPFTEFSPVYSNVSGGYGIFASYIKYEKIFKLK